MFVSTSSFDGAAGKELSFAECLLNPIPEAGHLWMPKMPLPSIQWPDEAPLHTYVELVMRHLAGLKIDLSKVLSGVNVDVSRGGRQGHAGDLQALNLHRGPTLSFKDVGCLCAAHIYGRLGMTSGRTVVATSGDTGSAAANAFEGANLPLTVLFPKDRVSPFQARQMLSRRKVTVMCVEGDFDDCQRRVKEAIMAGEAYSCNSISLARLLPQIGYYAYLASVLPDANVIVPSGNFGNACAAEMARLMGAPIEKVHFACNSNDAVARFVRGDDDQFSPKETVQTLATAMDVGSPSNFVRIMYLCGFDSAELRSRFTAHSIDDESIRLTSNFTFDGERLCPHTAVAAVVATRLSLPRMCIVRTADACKFYGDERGRKESFPYAPVCVNSRKALSRQRNIVLVGMPATGKSTLSEILNGVDTDALICEAEGKCLHEVIEGRAIERFIELEASIASTAVREREGIIATGGSVIYTDLFRRSLQNSLVIWLDVNLSTISQRLGDTWNSRGVISPYGTTSLKKLYEERCELYAQVADVRLDTARWDVNQAADFLRSLLR